MIAFDIYIFDFAPCRGEQLSAATRGMGLF